MKSVYEFLERAPLMICKNNEDMTKEYFNFMLKILTSPLVDTFTDLVIRKVLLILQQNISQGTFSEEAYWPFIDEILQAFHDILCLRSNNDFLTLMLNTTKNTMPIWLYATDHFLALTGCLLQKLASHRQKAIQENEAINEQVQDKIIAKILEIYDNVLRNGEKSIRKNILL
jgi:hypothetical protein